MGYLTEDEEAKIAALRQRIAELEAKIHNWNHCAADAGYAGSEYHDDPKQVFDRVIEQRTALFDHVRRGQAAIKLKGRVAALAELLQRIDSMWSEDHSGPDDPRAMARFSKRTIDIWRSIHAILTADNPSQADEQLNTTVTDFPLKRP